MLIVERTINFYFCTAGGASSVEVFILRPIFL